MRLLFVGDVMLGRLMNDVLKERPPEFPWGDTLPLFQRADVRVSNLECALADHGAPWSRTPKIFHFRSDAKNVQSLQAAQIDAVSLANNHTLDFEEEALCETLTVLDNAGIHHAGAGQTLSEATRPALWAVQNLKFGLLSFTDNEPEWEATETRAGICYVPTDLDDARTQGLLATVTRIKAQVDVLIIAAHWGPNWGYRPPRDHPPLAHALIDAGADILFGHSGHVVRGVEWYHNRPIMYCLGDFVDDYAVDEIERNDRSCIFLLEIEDKRITRLLLYPTIIQHFQAKLASGSEREAIVAKMQQLCQELHTDTTWNEQEGALELLNTAAL